MLKNPTPRQIAIASAALITAVGIVIFLMVRFLRWDAYPWLEYLTWVLLFFVLTYRVILYFLQNYIYRKIKLIYKTIHQEKINPTEKNKSINADAKIFEDVGQQVADWAANQQKEIDQLRSWGEYRRAYLGDISHELKTPIFNIQGYLESVIDNGVEDAAFSLSFLKKASKNVDRLQTIIQDLETISKLETGNMLLEMTNFDIKELGKEVFEDLEIKAAERNISLEFKEGANQNYRVKADREKVRQVLINLIHNSIKYGIPNGRIKIAFYDMDKRILVEVADNGIGIPKEHLAHVFDRFYRVDKSRSRTQGGSGLGLSIVKHIIEAHSQTINVRSTPNLGSTFGFTLDKAG